METNRSLPKLRLDCNQEKYWCYKYINIIRKGLSVSLCFVSVFLAKISEKYKTPGKCIPSFLAMEMELLLQRDPRALLKIFPSARLNYRKFVVYVTAHC